MFAAPFTITLAMTFYHARRMTVDAWFDFRFVERTTVGLSACWRGWRLGFV